MDDGPAWVDGSGTGMGADAVGYVHRMQPETIVSMHHGGARPGNGYDQFVFYWSTASTPAAAEKAIPEVLRVRKEAPQFVPARHVTKATLAETVQFSFVRWGL